MFKSLSETAAQVPGIFGGFDLNNHREFFSASEEGKILPAAETVIFKHAPARVTFKFKQSSKLSLRPNPFRAVCLVAARNLI